MKKADNLIIIILFAAFLLVIGLGGWLLKDQDFSENENRILQQLPQFSAQSLLSGEFESDFQNYQDDQFPFRNQWITLKTAAKLAVFSKDINGVYLGKEGYLIEKITAEDVNHERFASNLGAISQFCASLPEDVSKSVILVPTKAAVLGNRLPARAVSFDEQALAEETKDKLIGVQYVDLYPAFKEQSEGIYYKTDHHWTTEGAAMAYGLWKQQIHGGDFDLGSLQKQILADDFQGTLYSKVLWDDGTRDQIISYTGKNQKASRVTADGQRIGGILQKKHLKEKDKYAVFFGGNYGKLEIDTPKKNDSNLLIIKDSFANCFAPFAADDFEKVCMIDLRYFSGNLETYMKVNHITDVLILYSMSDMIKDRNISVLKNKGDVLS